MTFKLPHMTYNLATKPEVKRTILILGIFMLAAVGFAIIESYPNHPSAYNFGYLTGLSFGHMIKKFVILSLVVQAFRFRK